MLLPKRKKEERKDEGMKNDGENAICLCMRPTPDGRCLLPFKRKYLKGDLFVGMK
jgi:hypothetical protein